MNAIAHQLPPLRMSVEEYLRRELDGQIRHEFVGGIPYPMVGARNRHQIISGNAFYFLHSQLRRTPHRAFPTDAKVRVQLPEETRFYYPDAIVVERQNKPDETYQDEPIIIVEVLSRSTRRADEGEKKDAYLTIPSLAVYLLVEQEAPLVVAWRRTGDRFVREEHAGLEASIALPEIGATLPLAELYESVVFAPEPDDGV